MRNTLAFLGAAVLVFFGVGLYLGWYHIYREPSPTPGHSRIQVDIDQNKISSDVKQGASKLKDAIDKATTEPNTPADKKTETTPSAANSAKNDLTKDAIENLKGWYDANPKK